jgi:hypothetical protein
MAKQNPPILKPIPSKLPASSTTHDGPRLMKPPLANPKAAAKTMMPTLDGNISSGSQKPRTRAPENIETRNIILN